MHPEFCKSSFLQRLPVTPTNIHTGLGLQSLVTAKGTLELSLAHTPVPEPASNEVIIRVEASPINPSDLGLLLGPADLKTLIASGTKEAPVAVASIPERAFKAMSSRIDKPMVPGNEGAGTVIHAGDSAEAQALLGKTVATFGGSMYAQYRCAPVSQCVVLPEGITAAEGASIFVNPVTVLSMVDVMRREGHTALVHTAAASNLGQMLNRLCIQENIGLVNIVRGQEQADLLRGMGARYVCNSNAPSFVPDLTQALVDTGATLAFDAVGGGGLVSQILGCMEAAIRKSTPGYLHYGSSTHKQVYIYGALDTGPTELKRNCGPAFGVGGFLLMNYLQKIGPVAATQLQARVLSELKTTFACQYAGVLSLTEALQPENIAHYSQRATGSKFLINPSKGTA